MVGIKTRAAVTALLIIFLFTVIGIYNPWDMYIIISENTDYISTALFSALAGATIVTLASGRR